MPTKKYDPLFQKTVKEIKGYPFTWQQLKAQGWAESNLDPNAISRAGACGIMQIMPSTGQELKLSRDELFDPEKAIPGGAEYMSRQAKYWQHKVSEADLWSYCLASYNAGQGHIRNAYRLAVLKTKQPSWSDVSHYLPQITGKHSKETIDYVARCHRFNTRLMEI